MKFLRQFGAAAAVVTVVVLLGLAWNRFAPSLPGEGPAGPAFVVRGHAVKGVPPGVKLRPGRESTHGAKPLPAGVGGNVRLNDRSGGPGLLLGDLLKPVNLTVLRQTAVLEAAVIAGVVIVDASYRRVRQARRARASRTRRAPE